MASINPSAGRLLQGVYGKVGEMIFGDAIEQLPLIQNKIDMFINDSDHSEDFEERQSAALAPKLAAHAIVLSDNSHRLMPRSLYARQGYNFLFGREQPRNHWHAGAGIGAAYL